MKDRLSRSSIHIVLPVTMYKPWFLLLLYLSNSSLQETLLTAEDKTKDFMVLFREL